MESTPNDLLEQLFSKWSGSSPGETTALPRSGSDRRYFRMKNGQHKAIAVINPHPQENDTFIRFSRHFKSYGLPVPEIYAENTAANAYLQEDLGNTSLLQLLLSNRQGEGIPTEVKTVYKRALEQLVRMQVVASRDLDFGLCFPREAFDQQSMRWDLNYFKYFFLKLSGTSFDEQALETDFEKLSTYLMGTQTDFFMFRDFQARNIMVKDGEPYFIDYQGGRRGALQYDLASLLYQAKAALPQVVREELVDHYLDALEKEIEIDRQAFREYFYGYVLIRTLQVLGAYGFRGFFERKSHFLESIPFALQNLAWIRANVQLPVDLPELNRVMDVLPNSPRLQSLRKQWEQPEKLTLRVASFSYKKGGIPQDPSGNGGGFVFDCRGLHNPGRYAPYKKLTGRDQPVIDFLLSESEIEAFLQNVYQTVSPAIENYLDRGFDSLMVSFGCTGGQHRSVYSADQFAAYVGKRYGVNVELSHIEQEAKGWIN